MNRGILFAIPGALVCGALVQACRPSPDPGQLRTVDSLITDTEAARRALEELDTSNYAAADAFHARHADALATWLADTLDASTAELLANAAICLGGSATMAEDHRGTITALKEVRGRLGDLRNDLLAGAVRPEEGRTIVGRESALAEAMDSNLHHLVGNYKALQQVMAQLPRLDSLLTPLNPLP